MERFIICRASAGSGKTYTLVRQYIEAAIAAPHDLEHRFERILAITFTNKAANGMKQRIMRQLRDIADANPKSMRLVDEMASHLGVDSQETVRRCALLQSAILHHYSDFSVCTIDSFVHRLVRTFAHDLNLPMNFDIQLDEQEVLQWSVDELLSVAGRDDEAPLTQVLCNFVEARMEDGASYELEAKLIELAAQILKEETPRYLSQLDNVRTEDFIAAFHKMRADNRAFEQRLADAARLFVDACRQKGLGIDDFPNKRTGIFPFFLRLANGDMKGINDEHKRVDQAAASGVLYAKSSAQATRDALEEVTPAFKQSYAAIHNILDSGLKLYNSRILLMNNIFGLALLGRINDFKNRYYRENETVHISEFNKRIADEVTDEPVPFIYERIGSRYTNYMIDEFQDTSKLQWLNFLPLLDEAMAQRPSSSTALPGLQSLVVGDGKQAIYRFRQGDVRQFMNLPEVDHPLHGKSLKPNAKIDSLVNNYRTLANIVEFNNRFFKHIITHQFAANPELQQLYIGDGSSDRADLEQIPVRQGGYVNVAFFDREQLYAKVLETIRHQVDDLGYGYGDIMLLARKNDILSGVAEYLMANSADNPIPMVSAQSFILSNSKVVLLVQSLLCFLYDPKDRVTAVNILQDLYALGVLPDSDKNERLWLLQREGFDLVKLLSSFGFQLDVERLRSLSLYDCCEQLLRTFGLQGRDSAYVAALLNVVCRFQQRNNTGLRGLNDYLKSKINQLSCSTTGDIEAVQLMTVHKAKGLESKIVIYLMPAERERGAQMWVDVPQNDDLPLPVAFVGGKKDPTVFDELFDQERRLAEMDRINILYVALTRPEDKLIVIGERRFADDRKDNNSLLMDFVASDPLCVKGENDSFSVGEDVCRAVATKDDKENEGSKVLAVNNVVFPAWQDRVAIASQGDPLLSSVLDDSRRYGILVHDILSHIRHYDEMEAVVDDYCHVNGYDNEVRDAVMQRIKSMMDNDDNRHFFDPSLSVCREVPLSVDGKVLRPDRVVFDNGVTWVVDFKTGSFSEEKHAKYEAQVAAYCDAISRMGYPDVRPAIVYV